MNVADLDRRWAAAELRGYTFLLRNQPQADLEEPDWIVVVRSPDGRQLFPGAVDGTRDAARRRGVEVAENDLATLGSLDSGSTGSASGSGGAVT